MVKKKGKSGRKTLKQKYKIDKKVKEHKRQERKDARKNPKKSKRKDPGIPNSIPFKAQVLAEIEYAKQRAEEVKAQQKEKRKVELMRRRGLLPPETTMESLAQTAQASQAVFIDTGAGDGDGNGDGGMEAKQRRHGEQSRRAYLRELRKVVDHSDVVLQVLDARDPMGSRASAVEEAVLSRAGKRLVLVLNKVDLVPKEVVAQWLKVLRLEHPAVAFKASTQGGGHIQQGGGDAVKAGAAALARSGSVGAEALMNILKNYCRSLDIKTAITVGVIGYPNVGKSSLINSLKRSKAVGVSPTPGFTRAMQEVTLDKMVKLLDCPGVVFDDADGAAVLLRNCVDCESLPDPAAAVAAVLQRAKPEQLMQVYEIARFDPADVQGFLALVARKLGKLLRGGTPDRVAAARHVLRDWNSGKVPYYTLPPDTEAARAAVGGGAGSGTAGAGAKPGSAGDAQLVDAFGPAFDPLALEAIDQEMMDALPASRPGDFMALRSAGVAAGRWSGADTEDADMDESEEEQGGAAGGGGGGSDSDSDDDSDDPIKRLAAGRQDDGDDSDSDAEPPPLVRPQRGAAVDAAAAAAEAQSAKERSKEKSRDKAPAAQLGAMLAEERRLNPQVNRDRKRAVKAQKKQAKRQARGAAPAEAYDFSRDYYGGDGAAAGAAANGNGALSDDDDL